MAGRIEGLNIWNPRQIKEESMLYENDIIAT